MPSDVVSLLSNVALSFDGTVLGLTLAYAAVRTIIKFTSSFSALRKLQYAPVVGVTKLRSMLSVLDGSDSEPDSWSRSGREEFVILRGWVMPKYEVEPGMAWDIVKEPVFKVQGYRGNVVLSQSTHCIYNEWKGFFGWTSCLRAILSRSSPEQKSSSLRMIPFALVKGELGVQYPEAGYVVVNLDGSKHHLPLTTVGPLNEQRILPVGDRVNAVGRFFLKNGIAQIKSCNDLPYFLTKMTKDQMVSDLALRTTILSWSSILLGSASIGILGFAFVRNWNRWKEWRQPRRDEQPQQSRAAVDKPNTHIAEDEAGDVPDGQLCVICLMRRRGFAFVPCGHLVCCSRCALSVQREVSPKCVVCRQPISNSLRIYVS